MICYKVVDDCIILRKFRKRKESTDAEVANIVRSVVPDSDVLFMDLPYGGDLYKRCCELSYLSEEAALHNWFVSHDNANIVCLAVLAVVERYSLWRVLMEETDFYEWMKGRIR